MTTTNHPTDDQTSEEIRVYEHYATLPQAQDDDDQEATTRNTDDQPLTTTKIRPNNNKRQRTHKRRRAKLLTADDKRGMGLTAGTASEAEDLANDTFFYEKLAKEDPNSAAGDPDGKDVEFVEPVNTGKAKGVDTGVVILQGRKGAGGVKLGSEDESIPDKYSESDRNVSDEDVADEDREYRARVVDNDNEEDGDNGDYGDHKEVGNYNDEHQPESEENEEPKSKSKHFTREFDSTVDLLKEVEDIVKRNEKLTQNSDDDVYWEVKYEHPSYK